MNRSHMLEPELTCWTLIRSAASGDGAARESFARIYLPVVRAYLSARWRAARKSVDDAAQDVFVECFRAGGLLEKVDSERSGGFRAFLLGAVRNVARRHETRIRFVEPLPAQLMADDTGPAEAFDRAWARTLLREAARVQESAAGTGTAAARRVQLLRLRFQDGRQRSATVRPVRTAPVPDLPEGRKSADHLGAGGSPSVRRRVRGRTVCASG